MTEPTEPAANTTQKPMPFLLTIGDIGVTDKLVVTSSGNAPLAGSQWFVSDDSSTIKTTPTWAIILAIIGLFVFLLGLLFLLVKEERTTGHVQVSVHSGSLRHTMRIPVGSPNQVYQIRAQVHEARRLAVQAQNVDRNETNG